jgi:hypothetical protein
MIEGTREELGDDDRQASAISPFLISRFQIARFPRLRFAFVISPVFSVPPW